MLMSAGGRDNFADCVRLCVCARVFADTVGLGEEARGEERRWKVPVGGWRFEMVISLAQD